MTDFYQWDYLPMFSNTFDIGKTKINTDLLIPAPLSTGNPSVDDNRKANVSVAQNRTRMYRYTCIRSNPRIVSTIIGSFLTISRQVWIAIRMHTHDFLPKHPIHLLTSDQITSIFLRLFNRTNTSSSEINLAQV